MEQERQPAPSAPETSPEPAAGTLANAGERAGFSALLAGGSAEIRTTGQVRVSHDADNRVRLCLLGSPCLRLPDGREARGPAASAELLAAYCRAGHRDLSQLDLRGRFALALVDEAAGEVWLATDRMATVPVYFAVLDDRVAFGTAPSAAADTARGPGSHGLDAQALFNYVYFHMIPAPRAVYPGVGKLRAAEVARLSLGAAPQIRKHWLPRFRATEKEADSALAAQLREALAAAVRDAAAPARRCGTFLSGGLDSSTVTGLHAEAVQGEAVAFAIGFEAEGYDEMPWARLAADHFAVRLVERYVTPDDVVDALPALAGSFGEPFGNSSALPAYFCAREARDQGVDLLLAGDGGDELFAGNERYREQLLYERYRSLPGVLKSVIGAVARSLPARPAALSKPRRFVNQAAQPLAARLQRYNFLHVVPGDEVFTAAFRRLVDEAEPLRQWTAECDAPPPETHPLDRMLYLDWQYTLADNDLRKVSHACSLAGVDVAYPMLDDRVVDLSLRIPAARKLRRGRLRSFYKQAFRGWLPDATIGKSKHGFGLPFGVWMRDHAPLRDLAYDSLAALSRRGLFRESFIDLAIARHRGGHASYYGELVWVLAVLELWLQQNADDLGYPRP